MTPDPNERGAGLSVTIKQDSRDGTWVVFHGSIERIREDMAEAMDIPNEGSLSDMIASATAKFKGEGNVARVLGGKPTAASSPNGGSSPSEGSGSREKGLEDIIREEIESAATTDALRAVWGKHSQHVPKGSANYDLFREKSKELSSK